MRLGPIASALAAMLLLAACASPRGPGPYRPSRPPHPPVVETPSPPAPPPMKVERFSDLPGWAGEDHVAAFEAYRATCQVAKDPDSVTVCRRAMSVDLLDEAHARAFFEDNFIPERLAGEGVLTAYYAPEYEARAKPTAEFSAPLRPRPDDLVQSDGAVLIRGEDGALRPYPRRDEIEARPATDALAWMRPEELFFLQIQGSGVLTFPGGKRLKALYAAHNGQPFTPIANPMRDRGLLAPDATSGEAIRGWLAAHRGPEADEIMRINPRYAFFRLAEDDGLPPVGAANIPLPAGRAIAVDLTRHGLGEVYWIDGASPILAGAFPSYRRLVTALDTGGAIKGDIRADLYLGQGPAAGAEAGRVRHTLRLHRLVPRP